MFLPAGRVGADQRHCPRTFLHAIQAAVSISHTPLAELFGIPDHFTGIKVLTGPPPPVGIAVQVSIVQQNATMLVFNVPVVVVLNNLVAGVEGDLPTANAVA